eukprot:EG_transcript_6897
MTVTNPLRGHMDFSDYGTLSGPPNAHCPPEVNIERLTGGKTSSSATIFHMVNLYVGLGLLAQAYALQQGGWLALLLMGVCCWFASYTGKLLVRCFRRLQEEGLSSADASWANLADFVWDFRAKWIVFVLALAELFGAGCMAMLMLWRNLEGLLPDVEKLHIELGTVLFIVPSLFAQGFGNLVFVSVLGVVSKALTTFLPVVMYFATSDEPPVRHSEHQLVNLPCLPMAFAIVMLSYSAHVALPSIYVSMAKPADFERVTTVAFLVMLAQYAVMGFFGYLLWGHACSPIITYDATRRATRHWERLYTQGVSFLVAWSIYATIVPIISVVADTIRGMSTARRRDAPDVGLKLSLLLGIAALCHLLDGRLGLVEAVLGVIATIVSLSIPLAMHLKLFGPAMSRWARLKAGLLLAVSGGCVLLVAATTLRGAVGAALPTPGPALPQGSRSADPLSRF